MIYTIGHCETYYKAMESNPLYKRGRHEDYLGGYAFKSIEDAQKKIDESHRDSGFAIFGLDADWDRDTVESSAGSYWHYLLVDSLIIDIARRGDEKRREMSTNIAAVRFLDGTILYTSYQNTSDVLGHKLYRSIGMYNTVDNDPAVCLCGRSEEAEAATWGVSWNVTACVYCEVVVEGQEPFWSCVYGGMPVVLIEVRDEPEWWKMLIKEYDNDSNR